MLMAYGQGVFQEGPRCFRGRIVLNDHRLFLQGPDGDLAATYIPMEKVVRVRRTLRGLKVYVRASMVKTYQVLIKGQRRHLGELVRDLVKKRYLTKKFIWPEWYDASS